MREEASRFPVPPCGWSGTPVHLRDDGHDVLLVDVDDFLLAVGAPFLEHVLESGLGLLFLVAQGGGLFEVLFLDGGFLLAR